MATIEYVEDFDSNTGPDGNKGAKRRAFALKEEEAQTLVWRGIKEPGPVYQPYVIRAELHGSNTYDRHWFQFRFLKKNGKFGSTVHVIDLDDRRTVWSGLPSSLEGLSLDYPCAFLFLTEDLKDVRPDLYKDGHVNGHRGEVSKDAKLLDDDTGTGGNGKWPRAAGRAKSKHLEGLLGRIAGGALTEEDIALLKSLGAS
jgi:hypothetical protein